MFNKGQSHYSWTVKGDGANKLIILNISSTTIVRYARRYTRNNSQFLIMVLYFWIEGYQLQRDAQKLYLGWDLIAKIYWKIKEGSRCILNQLVHHLMLTISLKGPSQPTLTNKSCMTACMKSWKVYHINRINNSIFS